MPYDDALGGALNREMSAMGGPGKKVPQLQTETLQRGPQTSRSSSISWVGTRWYSGDLEGQVQL